jgi:thiol-disulfide isomerase/thioredoxin
MRTLALILSGFSWAFTAPAADTPRPSPELTMQRAGGSPFRLSQFRGKIVALAFSHTGCSHCQDLTRILTVIQKDYAARNVQVVECVFNEDAATALPAFLKELQPGFPVGYTTDPAVKEYLKWDDKVSGILYVPYMIFVDSRGTIKGDYSGRDGFFRESDKRIRAVLDQMLKPAAPPAAKKK